MVIEIDQVIKAKKVLQLSAYSYLIDRLAEYFPHTDTSWLTDENDPAFGEAFTADGDGWLTTQQDSQFWSLISEASETEASDALSNWLQVLLDEWGARGAPPGVDEAAGDVDTAEPVQRFNDDEITPVGEDYPGWWQGYDYLEGEWKYIESTEAPTGESEGWMVSDVAFPAMQSIEQPTEESEVDTTLDDSMVELVPGMTEAAQQGAPSGEQTYAEALDAGVRTPVPGEKPETEDDQGQAADGQTQVLSPQEAVVAVIDNLINPAVKSFIEKYPEQAAEFTPEDLAQMAMDAVKI
jgi:hypothetical protein